MIEPYYETKLGKLYCGDSREIQSYFRDVIVITDPPYNVDYHYEGYNDNLKEWEYKLLLENTIILPSVVIHYPEDMFIVSQTIRKFPDKCVSWVYNGHTPRKWRMIAWYGVKPDFSLIKQPYKNLNDKRIKHQIEKGSLGASLYDWWSCSQVKNISKEKTRHPCQIPIEIMEKIIGITICDVVLDPFLGSGTTAVACERLKRRWIGIEISKEYCDIAVKRLQQEECKLK